MSFGFNNPYRRAYKHNLYALLIFGLWMRNVCRDVSDEVRKINALLAFNECCVVSRWIALGHSIGAITTHFGCQYQ